MALKIEQHFVLMKRDVTYKHVSNPNAWRYLSNFMLWTKARKKILKQKSSTIRPQHIYAIGFLDLR